LLVGHLSDTHLGAAEYNLREREEDVYEAFEEAVQIMIKDHVDLVIHAGDIFDVPKPSGTAIVKLVNQLKELKQHGIPFFFTLGEHDISRLREVPVPFLYPKVGLATYVGDGRPVRHDGLTIVGFHKRRKTEMEELQAKLKSLCSELAGASGKKILVLHQALLEFHKWAGEMTSSDLPQCFDYYAMGHLHDNFERRFDGLGGPVCYPGSIDATGSEGIREFKKGFYIVDLSGDEAHPQWVELKSLRRQLAPELDFERLEEMIEGLVEEIKGLPKKPLLNLRVRGRDIDSVKVANAIKPLQPYSLYTVWEPLEEGSALGKEYQGRPSDIDQEMLELADRVTGSRERAEFAVKELLPLVAEGRTDEATELLWSLFTSGKLLDQEAEKR
jgi:exonuclease SbcD